MSQQIRVGGIIEFDDAYECPLLMIEPKPSTVIEVLEIANGLRPLWELDFPVYRLMRKSEKEEMWAAY
jgi:hypothetical protein